MIEILILRISFVFLVVSIFTLIWMMFKQASTINELEDEIRTLEGEKYLLRNKLKRESEKLEKALKNDNRDPKTGRYTK